MRYEQITSFIISSYSSNIPLSQEAIEAIRKMDRLELKSLFEVLLEKIRQPEDYVYEVESMRVVSENALKLFDKVDLDPAQKEEQRKLLGIAASIYKAEMAFAPTGIRQADGSFDRNALNTSREFFARTLDCIFPEKGFGDIIRRKGLLGEILKVADDFNGMTSIYNPSKLPLDSMYKRCIMCKNEKGESVLFEIECAKLPLGATEYFYISPNGDKVNLNIGPRDLLKTPAEALEALQAPEHPYLVAKFKEVVDLPRNIGPTL